MTTTTPLTRRELGRELVNALNRRDAFRPGSREASQASAEVARLRAEIAATPRTEA